MGSDFKCPLAEKPKYFRVFCWMTGLDLRGQIRICWSGPSGKHMRLQGKCPCSFFLNSPTSASCLCLGTRGMIGCPGDRVLLEHALYDGVGMDALLTVCSWNTNVIARSDALLRRQTGKACLVPGER